VTMKFTSMVVAAEALAAAIINPIAIALFFMFLSLVKPDLFC